MSGIRYEIRRTDAGWHSVFIAANGQPVWSTEVYTRRHAAENAIETITGRFIQRDGEFPRYVWHHEDGGVEVRYVDLRLKRVARPELPEVAS